MATRRPLYYDNGDLREMSDTQINQIISRVSYLYSLNPSVTLNVVSSGGTLSGLPLTDTRKTAGAYRSFVNRTPSEAETDEPGTVTVSYSRLTESVTTLSEPVDTNNKLYPIYNSSSNPRAMDTTDMYDTFILPAISNLAAGYLTADQAGTYRIHTSTSLAGHTLVSNTPVFTDTRANTGAYSAGSIPEALDQPTTISNFYLFRIDGVSSSYISPVFLRSDNQLQTYTTATFDTALQNLVRYAAAQKTGARIRYNINGTGYNRGSGMTNTILNGSGNYQTRFVNADDYRAQEFPDGSPVTANTYYLRINQS